ncbi:pyruvoyl-dependent arginine decarboxylase [Halalkalirubrum salinum]|uniref:pyruvoyl-dependent arginine decarboxylase n=1 Tax=Halalkalirubrum salinum TaxID=2563889 RepID=UPI0010FB1400|nr:pyruvoyl-dependent arginine decarboxylase [Halalkalirubrum salinum]
MNPTIYVAGGVGRGPTEIAAYDAALAEINLHNYNLVTVSSIVPDRGTIQQVEAAPDLGTAGNRLFVVQSKAVAAPGEEEPIAAGLGWAIGPGPGLFYEATGPDAEAVRDELDVGLTAGLSLREWSCPDRGYEVSIAEPAADECVVAVVLAAYGDSAPMFR